MKRKFVWPVLLVLALSVALAGCGNLRKNAYLAWGSYVTAEETAADIATNKAIKQSIVKDIQDAEKIAAPVAEAMYKDLDRFARLQDEVKAIKAAGGTVDEKRASELEAAGRALSDSYGLSGDAIKGLVELVNKHKKGK